MGKYFRHEDIEISFLKGSGPGGQNRNKRETGVRVRHIPTQIVVMATERRSQSQNLEIAFERLDVRLKALFSRPKKRKASRPTHSSRIRRQESKKKHSEKKHTRKNVREEF